MRSRDEVLDKFREMRDSKLRDLKARFLSRSFVNCKHNSRLKVHGRGQVGFCQNPVVIKACGKKMFVCNEDNTAKRCREYCCKNTDESVEVLFDEILKSPARCGESYPKLAMLIWFLQDVEGGNRWNRFSYLFRQMGLSLGRLISFRWW